MMDKPRQPRASVLACSTGKDAERGDKLLPITRKPGGARQVVVSLGAGKEPYSRMPDLAPGDRIEISGELEVTTDAPDAKSAVAKPYGYNPVIDPKLVLAEAADVEGGGDRGVALASLPSEVCHQERHHTLVTFAGVSYTVPRRGLPWRGRSHLNLVLDAHHPSAREGQMLLIGQNEPPRRPGARAYVKGNMAKLNVVRYRGSPGPPFRRITAREPSSTHVPIRKGHRTVVYSARLDDLKRDEQLVVRGELRVSNPHHYAARVSTEVVASESRSGTDPTRAIAEACAFRGQICQFNGTNCLPDSTLVVHKYGTMRVLRSVNQHLFVNLAVTSSALDLGENPDPSAAIRVLRHGFVEVHRFRPGAAGGAGGSA